MIDVIEALKKKGVAHIYIMASYVLFTKGVFKFDEYYKNNMFDKIYTTNLSFIPEEFRRREWLHICDSSLEMAKGIYRINKGLSLSDMLSDKTEPIKLLEKKFRG